MAYTPSDTGLPCWYELGTTDPDAAQAFYEKALGWQVASAGMPGFDYRIASDRDGNGVAGLWNSSTEGGPAAWLTYTEVASADDAVARATAAGATVCKAAADIPGTGRFAVLADPQGAAFGVLQPEPMEQDLPSVRAFDQDVDGHGNWHELVTSDPQGALSFYTTLFPAWNEGDGMDMGESGMYHIYNIGSLGDGGVMGGGVMNLLGAPAPAWKTYFGVSGTQSAIERVTEAGGTLVSGPDEVPGGAHVAILRDPQGATFGVIGPLEG